MREIPREQRNNNTVTSNNINIKKMAQKISSIKKEVNELKAMSGGIQAVDKNIDRILASIKMLEINISDLLEVL
jgi:hypothetical protein